MEEFFKDKSTDLCQSIREGIEYIMEKHISKIVHLFLTLELGDMYQVIYLFLLRVKKKQDKLNKNL